MIAWVVFSKTGKRQGKTIKVDIDVCDQQGNVCVQMQGFSLRALESEIKPTRPKTTNNSTQHESNLTEYHSLFDSGFYQKLISGVVNREVSVDAAVGIR